MNKKFLKKEVDITGSFKDIWSRIKSLFKSKAKPAYKDQFIGDYKPKTESSPAITGIYIPPAATGMVENYSD